MHIPHVMLNILYATLNAIMHQHINIHTRAHAHAFTHTVSKGENEQEKDDEKRQERYILSWKGLEEGLRARARTHVNTQKSCRCHRIKFENVVAHFLHNNHTIIIRIRICHIINSSFSAFTSPTLFIYLVLNH